MRIEAREFEAVAARLRPGQRTRAEHCGMGEPMQISNGPAGVAAYCHRCGGKGFIPHQLSLSERIAQFKDAEQADQEAKLSLRLPEPRVVDPQQWPKAARLWLYKGGFSNDDIERLGFYYHAQMSRVVMPVYDAGRLVYWQARGFVPQLPKALNPVVDRTGLVAKFGERMGPVALTEDMLSAAKMAVACEAWALLGTKMDDAVLAALIRRGSKVVLALDSDKAGRDGAATIARRLSAVGVSHSQVYFGRDPKLVTRKEIIDAVQEHTRGGIGELDL